MERATPGTGTALGPWAPPAPTLDPAGAGWKRLLPARWGRFWPALRRGAAQATRRPRRELRMAEMLTLSEKRFLAVVRYGETLFLIGGAQNSIALLSRIEPPAAPTGHPVMFR
ncbi:MAG: flagellar biosynthetic protein FliO [Terriglobales bacterium]